MLSTRLGSGSRASRGLLWPSLDRAVLHYADAPLVSQMNSSMSPCYVILSAGQALHNDPIDAMGKQRPEKRNILSLRSYNCIERVAR
jgi:hypothetical protein